MNYSEDYREGATICRMPECGRSIFCRSLCYKHYRRWWLHGDPEKTANKGRPTHGGVYTPEYTVWLTMRKRCNDPKHDSYRSYGGRGISVCKEWANFANFYADMGPRPTPQHSIDRVDNNGNYEPSNCRWATLKEQHRNRRDNRMITHEGITAMCLGVG